MQNFIVLGRRTQNAVNLMPISRLTALDSETLESLVVTWQYENDTLNETGVGFFDTSPEKRLIVSTPGYTTLTINHANINSIVTSHNGSAYYGCIALKNDNTLSQWGEIDATFPIPAEENNNINTVATGDSSATALRIDGSIFSWGDPSQGGELTIPESSRTDVFKVMMNDGHGALLGENAPYIALWGQVAQSVPVELSDMNDINDIRLTDGAYAVLNARHQVFAWGELPCGYIPTEIQQLTDIQSITSNNYACAALRGNGQVVAWGINDNGGHIPDDIQNITDIVRIFPGSAGFIALRKDGSIVGWGADHPIPDSVSQLKKIVDVQYTSSHTGDGYVALCSDGTMCSWGNDGVDVPADISDVAAMTVILGGACAALKKDGSLQVFGTGIAAYITPVEDLLFDIRAVYSSGFSGIALKADDTIVVWGDPMYGGDMKSIPDDVQGNVSYLTD